MILAGDIGGTHTRLALFEKGARVGSERKFASAKYQNLETIVEEFLSLEKKKVAKACFGIAGPVRDGKCSPPNLPWSVDVAELRQALQIPFVYLLNDLEANAFGLKALKKEEFYLLNQGNPEQRGNQALISAGTGLGEAGLYWDGKKHHPFACEGGHTDFAPRDAKEIDLLVYLKAKYGHVSYERVVSGPGLLSIYQFLIDTGRERAFSRVEEEMQQKDRSMVISDWGVEGRDPACTHAVDWFISLYGAEAGNVALKFLSTGGVFIGGGIAPHLVKKMESGAFVSSFVDKGRFKGLLESIPIWVVLNDNAALLGAAVYAAAQ